MRKIRPILLLVAVSLIGAPGSMQIAWAQQPLVNDLTSGKRDTQAVAIIQKSLAALGGVNAIARVRTVESSGQIQKAGSQTPISFRWLTEVSGSHFEVRWETTEGAKTHVFASGHGRPGFGRSGQPGRELSAHMAMAALPLDAPAILLYAEFQDPTYAFTSLPASATDHLLHVQITNDRNFIMKAIVKQDWYFDPQTLLPVRIEHNAPSAENALDSSRVSCVYRSYTAESGVQYPSSMQGLKDGRQITRISIVSTQPNASIQSSEFDIQLATPRARRARP
ncbi:MAG: hypothetical protein ABI164_05145 [Acidobacteriaceae bacterium]